MPITPGGSGAPKPKPEPWEQMLRCRDIFLSHQGIGSGKKGQRHELIGVHGYDIKAAMHVIRLLTRGSS
jgi:hypothetical protein